MDKRKDERDLENATEASSAPGDILGLGRIVPDGATRDRAWEEEEDANQPPLPEERSHTGSRDVTEGTTGGTGPDTGGTGVYRRGSGATGTDIGR
jgi:hypothetical protein